MAIGIGLHCMYCDHGTCDKSCLPRKATKSEIRDKKIKEILDVDIVARISKSKLKKKKQYKKDFRIFEK